MTDLKFRVKAQSANATKTVVKARNFEIVVDEPADLGGTNEGANPVEFVLAAYCGCLNVMAHVIASEMKIELKGLKIDMVGDLNPAKLFGQDTEDRAGYKEIKVKLKPDCDADEDTLKKWMQQVLERCPVGDNLKNITPVSVELKLPKVVQA
ncbi:MAG: OsmC family protein [Marinifilaceae bacterium]